MRQQDFFAQVWDVVRQVPPGRVTTYGHIARYLGMRSGARMVGWAMNAAHAQSDVPAQRVVNRIGLLTGKIHFGHPEHMAELLAAEGTPVADDRVLNFPEKLWDPSIELVDPLAGMATYEN
jgi:methylated-DNA-protein-cysteine methyltransferase-like protein